MAAITNKEVRRRKIYIRNNYKDKKLKEMAKELGVNIDCVAQWMKVLGLKKYKINKNEN